MHRTISRWLIDHDPDATRRCVAQLSVGTGCTCNECRNFDAAAGRTFGSDFLVLLDTLGIDPTKPAELCHYYREPTGLYVIGGRFHFVGSILAGEDAVHWEKNNGTHRLEELAPGLQFGFTAGLLLVREVYDALPVVQLEFQTRVPWVLTEPEPST